MHRQWVFNINPTNMTGHPFLTFEIVEKEWYWAWFGYSGDFSEFGEFQHI